MSGLRNLIGQTLGGRYRIDEILGKGGMSAVYKAQDPNLRRTVAVKVIHAHLADDPKFITRFQEEAAAVARLRHPNIVQVHDFNRDEDLYYMVQEYISGETLQDRLRRLNAAGERMPIADAVSLAISVCHAAEYAHQRGMIHRDIKPANIMIDASGQGILMDFGIVKILGSERHTSTGVVVGTALYMSPETIHGRPPDRRSDIYSLGVTLFEMVGGRPPFDADSAMAVMMMHINTPVPSLSDLRPETPAALAAIIEKSLAKNNDERYASMADMAADLKDFTRRMQLGPPGTFNLSVAAPPASQPRSTAPSAGQATVVEPQSLAPSTDAARLDSHSSPPASAPNGRTLVETRSEPPPASRPEHAASSGPTSAPNLVQPAQRLDSLPKPAVYRAASPPSAPVSAAQPPANPAPPYAAAPATVPRASIALPALVGLAVVVILALGGLGFFALRAFDRAEPTSALPAAVAATSTAAAPTAAPTFSALIATEAPASAAPTAAPVLAVVPGTPTIPAGTPFALVNTIGLDSQGRYRVDYQALEFTADLADMHLVFFFDTQPADQGQTYAGASPFTLLTPADRPPNALSLCAAVANRDNSIRQNSGTCARLPDVVAISAPSEIACLSGPGAEFTAAAILPAGGLTPALGISADESWWQVVRPGDPAADCWLPVGATQAEGDISLLPLAEFTPQATSSLFVEITEIGLDAENRYSIAYVAHGFKEQLPGTHIHFFYDIFLPEQDGITGGNRLMYGGPSPFTGFRSVSRPPQATRICALVANPDHSIIPGSGNCFALPDS